MKDLSSAYLRAHFPGIKDDLLREDIAEHGTLYQFDEGIMVLKDAQYLDFVPLISNGGVKVVRHTETGENIFLYFIRPGETCAMTLSSCLKRQPSQIHATTVSETEIVLIPAERVYYYMQHFPAWNEYTVESFRGKIDDIVHAFDFLAFAPLETRITRFLNDLAKLRGSKQLNTTHAELATDMGASRVSVSRILKQMEEKSQISLGRNTIKLMNHE